MKPEKLILSGWGPYKDRIEVDFTRLEDRGLFLITGATGAGKTTLFDAITYALYGNMSGDVREKNSVRSDFADADTATFVELWMQHDGKKYHIIRNPEYMRPKKKKGGKSDFTKEKENARLYLPDGSAIEGSSEVNRRLQEILVLDYRQFKQISMIAQGEFARLLTASPAEKTKIFREIFETSIYDRFAGILRSRSNDLYKQVMEYRHRMEEDVHILKAEIVQETSEEMWTDEVSADNCAKLITWLDERLQMDKERLVQVQKNYAACEKETVKLTETISRTEQINMKLQKLEELKEQKKELSEQKKEIKSLEKELQKARAADGVKEYYIHWNNARKMTDSLQKKFKESVEALKQLSQKEQELYGYYELREAVQSGYRCVEDYEESRKRRSEAENILEKKLSELNVLQQSYVKQEENTEEKKSAYERADHAYKRAVVGLAAKQVKEGEPCPVCGSLEHPRVAVWDEKIPDEKEIQKLQKLYEKERKLLMEIHGKAAACKGELTACKERTEEYRKLEAELKERKEGLEPAVCDMIGRMQKKEYEKLLTDYHELQAQIREKKNRLAADEEEIGLQEQTVRDLEQEFSGRLKESGFASVKAYEEALRTAGQMSSLENRIREYGSKLQTIEDLMLHLKEETKGAKPVDMEGLQQRLAETNREKQQALKQLNDCTHQLQEEKKIAKSLKEKEKILQELVHEYGIVKDLDHMASGNNAKRLVFEQYVLAGYFEEILTAANLRLAKMTSGRYELSRMEEISDGRTKDNLEIRVFDYYTGKYRSVKTLSGGESFKASLALALGMSDVVQGYSGGIRWIHCLLTRDLGHWIVNHWIGLVRPCCLWWKKRGLSVLFPCARTVGKD